MGMGSGLGLIQVSAVHPSGKLRGPVTASVTHALATAAEGTCSCLRVMRC